MRTSRTTRSLLLALLLMAVPVVSQAGLIFSVGIAPPILPVYEQPLCPTAGYLWTPGYWAYGSEGYFWVPGTWAPPPYVGALWTPGYWGWGSGAYLWHGGYWGAHVGFYGGVNYGFGYGGFGYQGGYWNHGAFAYNTSVNRVNTTIIHNTYNKTVINNNTGGNRVSYNGGNGGIGARPRAEEMAAARERHTPATALQTQHENLASANRAQFYSVNHGNPSVAASPRPTAFHGGSAGGAGMQMNHPVANAARPGGVSNSPARPSATSSYHPAPASHPAERPQVNAARPNAAAPAHSYSEARPAQQPHMQTQSHPQSAPHMQSAPHAQNAPHAQSAPHAQQHSAPAAHGERHH